MDRELGHTEILNTQKCIKYAHQSPVGRHFFLLTII